MRTIGVLLAGALCLQAQWVNHPDPATPRTRDGKANLSAPAPRSNGKPDLSGIWQIVPTPAAEMKALFGDVDAAGALGDEVTAASKYALNLFADMKMEEIPMTPAATEIWKKNAEGDGKNVPTTLCLPGGVPFIYGLPIPMKIIQTPALVLMLFEGDSTFRQIYTDGRKRPADPQPLWLGYAVGRWDKDTLVVDTAGFNDKTWLDGFGHPHSEDLHLVERFTRRDFGHLEIQITVEDPKMYTRPVTVKLTHQLIPDSDILESICAENEKDLHHMK